MVLEGLTRAEPGDAGLAALERESGARGLRAILEEAMLEVMYEVPSKSGIKEVVVNEEAIAKGESPLVVYEKEAGVG
jgi:ATP-dependent Clp protease ATP-binding subunit ClpX